MSRQGIATSLDTDVLTPRDVDDVVNLGLHVLGPLTRTALVAEMDGQADVEEDTEAEDAD